jgi:hypothetical protein
LSQGADHNTSQEERHLFNNSPKGVLSAKAREPVARPLRWRFDFIESQDPEEVAKVDSKPISREGRSMIMRPNPFLPVTKVDYHPSPRLGGRNVYKLRPLHRGVHVGQVVFINLVHAVFAHVGSSVVRLEGGVRVSRQDFKLLKWRGCVSARRKDILGKQRHGHTE